MSHATVLVALTGEGLRAMKPKGMGMGLARFNKARIEKLVTHQMEPFDENGAWFKPGSRWDWWVIGGRWKGEFMGVDIISREALGNIKSALFNVKRKELARIWDMMQKDEFSLNQIRANKITQEEYTTPRISFHAFLRQRTWHENKRMGFFGMDAKAECEIAHGTEDLEGKCVHSEKDAKVVVWRGDQKEWHDKFWQRFIEPLPPEEILVVVDYHV